MSDTARTETGGREGEVMRTLPHGTVIIWDTESKKAYPFYRAAGAKYRNHEHVRFSTDETDTVVLTVRRIEPSEISNEIRKVKRDSDHKNQTDRVAC